MEERHEEMPSLFSNVNVFLQLLRKPSFWCSQVVPPTVVPPTLVTVTLTDKTDTDWHHMMNTSKQIR